MKSLRSPSRDRDMADSLQRYRSQEWYGWKWPEVLRLLLPSSRESSISRTLSLSSTKRSFAGKGGGKFLIMNLSKGENGS